MLLRKLIVPCILKRFFMIPHIAIANYSDSLAIQFVDSRLTILRIRCLSGKCTND